MGRCTPEIKGQTEKTLSSDTKGAVVVLKPCSCITFEDLQTLITAHNTTMPCPSFIAKSSYTPYAVPNELLMAIISLEAPCEGNQFIGKGGERIDIEFDPCAKNNRSTAVGLTQILKITMKDLIDQKVITGKEFDAEHKKICGDSELAIQYGSWNIQIKYIYSRKIKDAKKRLEAALDSAGTGYPYGKDRIAEMEKLQKSYTKKTLLEIIKTRKKTVGLAMALLRILVCMLAGLFAYSQECYAVIIDADNIEAMSTDCSDGTKVFGVADNDFMSSSLYIEKDGNLIYANDEFKDIQHIWSVYCSRHAILLMGTHGSYYSGSAVTADSNGIKTKFITGSRQIAQIKGAKGKLTVNVYGDDRYGKDKTIIEQHVFSKPFTVPSSTKSKDTATINMNTVLPGNPQKNIRLTTIASCYSPTKEDDFTIIAYIDESNLSGISIIDSYSIKGSTSTKYTVDIPFIATNSVCIDGEIYISGKYEKDLRSAKVYYNATKQKFEVDFTSQ